jgi:hypothetical protein
LDRLIVDSAFTDLLDVPGFGKVKEHIIAHKEIWIEFLRSPTAEHHVPQCVESTSKQQIPSSGKY